jgi:hypothetical protein
VRSSRRPNHNLDALIEGHQGLHQAFERDVLKLVAPHLRHLGLCHPSDDGNFGLAETALFDQVVQLHGERGFRRQLFRVFEPEVDENVVGAFEAALAFHVCGLPSR